MEEGEIRSFPWASDIKDLPFKINKLIGSNMINHNQCLVFKSLTEFTAGYVEQWWLAAFYEETKSNSADAVGLELVRVLRRGMQLFLYCLDADSPAVAAIILGSSGEFREIVDDVRIYAQMMNRLIARTLESCALDVVKQQILEQLRYKVDSDCCILQTTLTWGCEQDKLKLLHRLKYENLKIENLSKWQTLSKWVSESRNKVLRSFPGVVTGLIPMLEAGLLLLPTEHNIEYSDLEQGKGGYGDVKRAVWCNIPVAVKEFPIKSWTAEFKSFMRLLQNDSAHIVQILGHTKDNKGKTCLVLEPMVTDLGRLITPDSPFPLSLSVDIMIQIAKAMRHMHKSGLIYRHMKPSNVLVKNTEDECLLVKLADIDVSASNTGTVVMYTAPELLEGRDQYTCKVDVYSFGMLCSEILTGNAPFSLRLLPQEIIELLKKGERPPLPEGIPSDLKAMVMSCWEYSAHLRPSFTEICKELWLVKEKILISDPAEDLYSE